MEAPPALGKRLTEECQGQARLTGSVRPRDLRQLLCGIMLRRSKYEVLRDLPAKQDETIPNPCCARPESTKFPRHILVPVPIDPTLLTTLLRLEPFLQYPCFRLLHHPRASHAEAMIRSARRDGDIVAADALGVLKMEKPT